MQRRGAGRPQGLLLGALIALIGVAAIIVALALLVILDRQSSGTSFEPVLPPVSTVERNASDTGPVVTVTDFYPESANLSDCVGLVEKPGCGSESRGGWRQILVFVVLFAGLGVILWRVSSGIKTNRAAIDADAERSTDHPTDHP